MIDKRLKSTQFFVINVASLKIPNPDSAEVNLRISFSLGKWNDACSTYVKFSNSDNFWAHRTKTLIWEKMCKIQNRKSNYCKKPKVMKKLLKKLIKRIKIICNRQNYSNISQKKVKIFFSQFESQFENRLCQVCRTSRGSTLKWQDSEGK